MYKQKHKQYLYSLLKEDDQLRGIYLIVIPTVTPAEVGSTWKYYAQYTSLHYEVQKVVAMQRIGTVAPQLLQQSVLSQFCTY